MLLQIKWKIRLDIKGMIYAYEEQLKPMIDFLAETTEVLSLKEFEKNEVEKIKKM
jgi:hypothetical protein